MTHLYGYGEVIPLVPALPAAGEGLAALFPLLLWGLALALLVIWRHTFGALFTHLAHLFDRVSIPTPFGSKHPLGFVSSGLRTVDYAVQHILSVSADATERAAVYLFHKSLATFRAVGQEMYRLSEDMVRAVQLLERHRIPRLITEALIPPLAVIAATRTLIHALRVELRHGQTRARAQIHAVEHATTVALPRDIARVRTRVGRLEHDLEGESARVKRLAELVSFAGFAAFMWRWLGRYELRWLRCPSLARIGSGIGCVGFALLEDLLFGAIEAFVVTDICLYAHLATEAAELLQPVLLELVDVENALVGCHDATKPPKLSLASPPPPPKNAGLPLAA